MPTLQKWLEEGTHKVTGWETDLSSQTGASQAGILHGNNQDIPAFRWVEKDKNNKIMVSTGFSDAPLIEKRISDGNGLLKNKGASRSNLFSDVYKRQLWGITVLIYSRLARMVLEICSGRFIVILLGNIKYAQINAIIAPIPT